MAEKLSGLLTRSIQKRIIVVLCLLVGDSSWVPPAVDLGPYFPYLTDQDKRKPHYLQKLKNDTEKIRQQFEGLLVRLQEDVEKSQSLKRVTSLLRLSKTYPCFKEVLTNDSMLDDVFLNIREYCSFYSFGLVKHIAHECVLHDPFRRSLKITRKTFRNTLRGGYVRFPVMLSVRKMVLRKFTR